MKWVPEYNTGIDVIDDQHKRILDYINEIALYTTNFIGPLSYQAFSFLKLLALS